MNGTLGALAEPNRMRIVELLRGGPRSVNEIVETLELPQPLVSKHLRVLRDAGLVRVRPHAQQRVYELQPAPFEELGTWVLSFQRLWEDRLDTLDNYLQEIKKQKRGRK
jgi:DNA-binding transcriptional ArsR family regulator